MATILLAVSGPVTHTALYAALKTEACSSRLPTRLRATMYTRVLSLPLLAILCLMGCNAPGSAMEDDPPSNDSDDRYELAASYSAEKAGDALIIFEAGEVKRAEGQNGFDLNESHFLASGTKSFAGVMAWAAEADGLLDIDAPVAHVIPEWTDDEGKASITLYQLLTLTSGLNPGSPGQAPGFEEALASDLVHAPAEGFRYGPGAFQAFGGVLTEALNGEGPTDYLQRRILDPIGASFDRWNRVDGDPQLAGGAFLTADDWLRFGQLVLNDGSWNGTQVVPPGLQDALRQAPEAAPAYGLSFWLNAPVSENASFLDETPIRADRDGADGFIYADGPNDVLMAAGLFNQRLYVIPSHEMVIVRFGRADPSWNDAEFLARVIEGEAIERPSVRASSQRAENTDLLASARLAQLTGELDLTSEQRDTLEPIIEDHMEAMSELLGPFRSDDRLRPGQRIRLLRQIRTQQEATDEAIEAVLTEEQVERYRELRNEEREMWREQR